MSTDSKRDARIITWQITVKEDSGLGLPELNRKLPQTFEYAFECCGTGKNTWFKFVENMSSAIPSATAYGIFEALSDSIIGLKLTIEGWSHQDYNGVTMTRPCRDSGIYEIDGSSEQSYADLDHILRLLRRP